VKTGVNEARKKGEREGFPTDEVGSAGVSRC